MAFPTEMIARIENIYHNTYINPVTKLPGENNKCTISDTAPSGKKRYVEVKIADDLVTRLNLLDDMELKKYIGKLWSLLCTTFFKNDGMGFFGVITIVDIKQYHEPVVKTPVVDIKPK
jgi:hypothetical protein